MSFLVLCITLILSSVFFFFFLVFLFFFFFFFFFFNDTATTEIYTFPTRRSSDLPCLAAGLVVMQSRTAIWICLLLDRKSTRLNSSHLVISYAVFCLKKKKKKKLL